MKYILFTGAALGAAFFSPLALAHMDVTLGGKYDFQYGIARQDDTSGPMGRPSKFLNETNVLVTASGKTENGVDYGVRVRLQADLTRGADGTGLNANETSLYLGQQWGRVVLGNAVGPEEALQHDASTITYATGGIGGDWYHFITIPAAAEFNVRPGLRLAHGTDNQFGVYSNATKVQYYTPQIAGFQLGVSYTPDVGDRGQLFSGKTNGNAEEVVSAGLAFEHSYRDFNLALSATGETGGSESAALNDVNDWAVGGTLSFQGFTIGAGYYDWQDSYLPSGADAYSWNMGVGYDQKSWATSLGYHHGELSDNRADLVSLGVEYRLGAGLTPYAEATWFKLDPASPVLDSNQGESYIMGVNVSF